MSFIQDMYPSEPPLWFAVSDNEAINNGLDEAFETLNNSKGNDKKIICQVCFVHIRPVESMNNILYLSFTGENVGKPVVSPALSTNAQRIR